MNLRLILLLGLSFFLINCNSNKHLEKEITVNINSNEKYYYFLNNNSDTLRFDRNIEIIKNTLSDTIILGNGILFPKYTGQYWYGKFGNRKDVLLAPNYENPPADRIWISSYRGRKSEGLLKFRLIIDSK